MGTEECGSWTAGAAGVPAALESGATLSFSAADSFGGAVLPEGVPVAQTGKKWTVGENALSLKLKYKAKDGTFKGSFKTVPASGGKAASVSVAGVMIDSRGRGFAYVKKTGEKAGLSIAAGQAAE